MKTSERSEMVTKRQNGQTERSALQSEGSSEIKRNATTVKTHLPMIPEQRKQTFKHEILTESWTASGVSEQTVDRTESRLCLFAALKRYRKKITN